ncbi:putative L-tryptophan--pyruvate aminotransferase 1-like [Capsicum annuum]|nr:putative L-tryptophan--pyruvate aminotransferase 1-like [Capsicum annuum]
MFQGLWLMVIGVMLWTPKFIPKDCYINLEEGYQVVRCHGHKALGRAKSLVNIEFSWYVIGTTCLVVSLYLVCFKIFTKDNVDYQSLKINSEDHQEEDWVDVEAQKRSELKKFVEMGKVFAHN